MPALLGALLLLASRSSHAVSFSGKFWDPPAFFAALAEKPELFPGADRGAFARALEAVVLVGGRASGVLISSDGLMITAKHVLDTTKYDRESCERVPLFLHHEIGEDGSRDARFTRLRCRRVLVNSVDDDFALLKVESADGSALPFAEPARATDDIQVGMTAAAAGHPHALNFEKSVKKLSVGEVVLYEPEHAELPHFLHLIDTEGGNSGCAIFDARGRVVGMHFRGVPRYADGVKAVVKGEPTVIHRFNVALPMPYLAKKYLSSSE
jgi:S1-C subfamily serine protease